jgi:hypothetical protein
MFEYHLFFLSKYVLTQLTHWRIPGNYVSRLFAVSSKLEQWQRHQRSTELFILQQSSSLCYLSFMWAHLGRTSEIVMSRPSRDPSPHGSRGLPWMQGKPTQRVFNPTAGQQTSATSHSASEDGHWNICKWMLGLISHWFSQSRCVM